LWDQANARALRLEQQAARALRGLATRLDPSAEIQHGYTHVWEAAEAIKSMTGVPEHRIAMILGSGYGDLTKQLVGARSFPMASVPHMPVPKVSGHNPNFYSYPVAGENVLIYGGRIHAYEGHGFNEVTFAVRAAIMAGAQIVILTNAAGGVEHGPESLVFLKDHLIESPMPVFPHHEPELGPKFLDPSGVWDKDLREQIVAAAKAQSLPVFGDGVYVWGAGPLYETPHYVDVMNRVWKATLFGMSTVPEALAAHAMGVRVLGLSAVSNWAAGKNPNGPQALSHAEVEETLAHTRANVLNLMNVAFPICSRALTSRSRVYEQKRSAPRRSVVLSGLSAGASSLRASLLSRRA